MLVLVLITTCLKIPSVFPEDPIGFGGHGTGDP